jgi:signal peptidase I
MRIYLPFSHLPQRGDVAVFKLPTDPSVDYIKRIVGLPGDRIQMRHGNLYINDQLVPRRAIDDFVYEEGGSMIVIHQYIESLPRAPGEPALEHPIIKVGNNGPLDNTPVYEVPQGHYFAMGDNRDNSQDSRVLSAVGYVPSENLVGKAQILFFSTDGSARWWEIWKWPFGIRYRRLLDGVV